CQRARTPRWSSMSAWQCGDTRVTMMAECTMLPRVGGPAGPLWIEAGAGRAGGQTARGCRRWSLRFRIPPARIIGCPAGCRRGGRLDRRRGQREEERKSDLSEHEQVPADAGAIVADRAAQGTVGGRMPAMYLGHGAPPLVDDPLWTTQLAAWASALQKP